MKKGQQDGASLLRQILDEQKRKTNTRKKLVKEEKMRGALEKALETINYPNQLIPLYTFNRRSGTFCCTLSTAITAEDQIRDW